MDDESWAIFRDKVEKVYLNNHQRSAVVVSLICLFLSSTFLVVLVATYTNSEIVFVVATVVPLAVLFMLMWFFGRRQLRLIHDGLLAVCDEQNALFPDISFQAIHELEENPHQDNGPCWHHYIEVQFESDLDSS